MTEQTGNQTVVKDLASLLLVLKQSVMKDIKVMDICKVDRIEGSPSQYICTSINDKTLKYACYAVSGLSISVGDVAVVIYADVDYRANYRRLKSNAPTQDIANTNYHNISYGLILAKI